MAARPLRMFSEMNCRSEGFAPDNKSPSTDRLNFFRVSPSDGYVILQCVVKRTCYLFIEGSGRRREISARQQLSATAPNARPVSFERSGRQRKLHLNPNCAVYTRVGTGSKGAK